MRIGSIAQHSNIGPLSPNILGDRNSIIPNHVPGRLNDFPIYAWWDFTDIRALGGGSSDAIATNNLQQCDDKGPHDTDLSTDNTTKGPRFLPTLEGYGGHYYISSLGDNNNDYMKFTTPDRFYFHNFTSIIVMDLAPDSITKSKVVMSIRAGSGKYLEIGFDKTYQTIYVSFRSSGTTYTWFPKGYFTGTINLSSFVGGQANFTFNYIYIVGDSGKLSVYFRGVEIPMQQVTGQTVSTDVPDDNVPAGNNSYVFNDQESGSDQEDSPDTTNINALFYELLIYKQALNSHQLMSIDHYIKDKYNYEYGRINGYTT